MDYQKRRERLAKSLKEAGGAALLVTNFVNVTYLTGFTGEDSYLIVHRDGELLISDPRYEEQIAEECPGLKTFIRTPQVTILSAAIDQLRLGGWPSLLVEADTLTLAAYEQLKEKLPALAVGGSRGLVEALRAIKDKDEIAMIRVAIEVAQRVFTSVRATLRSTQTEWDVACEIDRVSRQLGATGTAFKPIVAVGSRAALPHAVPGKQAMSSAPFVLIDWGAIVGGYRSDLTRVLTTGKIPPKFPKIYETVLAAQQAAIAAMRPGVMVSQIDRIAREVIEQQGMGKRFNHGLGHGIGLDIHEAPRLGKNQDRPLEPGMIVTVEPGIYYPGFGGVRIEDDILITRDGHEVLSDLPRTLDENRVELLG
ncbi:MAG: aminopeptidase P family protein [Pirellulaceae bacterium]|nr:aminopeptidase P family protein [Pirellulaceae bacterium]